MKAILVKSFTDSKEEGNPAGVVLDANSLSDDQMLKITQELGFGESAFLEKTNKSSEFNLRLFSTKGEVNSCATATIAAAHLIFQKMDVSTENIIFNTKIGNIKMTRQKDGVIFAEFPQAQFIDSSIPLEKNEIATLLNIDVREIGDLPLQIASIGTPKLLIPIKTLDSLFKIKPNLEGISEYCKKSGAMGFYPFTLETRDEKSDFHARQFNPLAGISEDPATGVAAGALAGYLKANKISGKDYFTGEQGYIVNVPSRIMVELTPNSVKVGGLAVVYGEREVSRDSSD